LAGMESGLACLVENTRSHESLATEALDEEVTHSTNSGRLTIGRRLTTCLTPVGNLPRGLAHHSAKGAKNDYLTSGMPFPSPGARRLPIGGRLTTCPTLVGNRLATCPTLVNNLPRGLAHHSATGQEAYRTTIRLRRGRICAACRTRRGPAPRRRRRAAIASTTGRTAARDYPGIRRGSRGPRL